MVTQRTISQSTIYDLVHYFLPLEPDLSQLIPILDFILL
jgi:hypothetical protein